MENSLGIYPSSAGWCLTRRTLTKAILGGLGIGLPVLLGGCSLSLQEFLESPTRLPLKDGDEESTEYGSGTLPPAEGSDGQQDAEATDTQYGFWVDATACVGCLSCVAACRKANATPRDAEARRRVISYSFAGGETLTISLACMHCAEPACARVCPAGAISKCTNGVVVVDKGRCLGCCYCRQACPFDVPRYYAGTMDKCDCCLSASGVKEGHAACAEACPTEALHFGVLDNLRVQAGTSARLLESETRPSFVLSVGAQGIVMSDITREVELA